MNPNDMIDPNQLSLLQMISGMQDALSRNTDINSQAGINPQIQQGQDRSKLATQQFGQQSLDTPPAPIQNWQQNPNSPYAAQEQALLAQGPPGMQQQGLMRVGALQTGFDPSMALHQGMMNEYNQRLNQAHVNANFDTTMLSPAQMQQAEEAQQAGRLNMASGLMQGPNAQIRPQVDPAALATLTGQGAPVQSASATAAGSLNAARASAQGVLGAAQIKAGADLGVAQTSAKSELEKQLAANKGLTDVEAIKGGTSAANLAPDKAADAQASLAAKGELQGVIDQVAQTFNPKFYTYGGERMAHAAQVLNKTGLLPEDARAFGITPEDSAQWNQHNIAIRQLWVKAKNDPDDKTSSRDAENLMKSMLSGDVDPEDAMDQIANLSVNNHSSMFMKHSILQRGLAGADNANDAFLKKVQNGIMNKEDRAKLLLGVYQDHPNLMPSSRKKLMEKLKAKGKIK